MQDDEPMVELPEHIAQAIMGLDALADNVLAGNVRAYMVLAQTASGVSRMWMNPGDVNLEPLALAAQEFGHRLHRDVCRRQGNAPPQNRSDAKN